MQNRPSSAASTPGVQSRPDLKQSILSLYASAPRPQQAQQQQTHNSQGSFGGMQSPPLQQQQQQNRGYGGMQSPPIQQQTQSFGGMNDAFGGLSFSNPSSPPVQAQPKQSAFSGLGNLSSHTRTPSQNKPPQNLSGGSFFDTKPIQPSQKSPPPQPSRGFSSSSGFGDFGSSPGMSPAPAASSSGMADLFDFASPAQNTAPKQTVASPVMTSPQQSSVFNLSQPAAAPKPQVPVQSNAGDWSNNDAWGSSDAWGTAKTSPVVAQRAAPAQTNAGNFGWGSGGNSLATQSIVPGGNGGFTSPPPSTQQPKVSADDDFGGWSSAAPVTPASSTQPKPAAGFGASEDLFSNVWQ